MPIYEYRCPKCGHEFEKLVPITTDPKDVDCPKCAREGVEKKMSLFGTSGGDTWSSVSSAAASPCGPTGST